MLRLQITNYISITALASSFFKAKIMKKGGMEGLKTSSNLPVIMYIKSVFVIQMGKSLITQEVLF